MALVPIAHAANEAEAAIIRAQLDEAGIRSFTKGPDVPQQGIAGAGDIYVEDDLADRARAALETPTFSEDELARLSDEAGREYGDAAG